MKVRDLVNLLLDYPMDSDVYVEAYGEYTLLDKENFDLDKHNDLNIRI